MRRYYERRKQKEEIKSKEGLEHPYAPEICEKTKRIIEARQIVGERKGKIEERLIGTLD